MSKRVAAHPLAAYLAIAYLASWACWLPLVWSAHTVELGVGWPSHIPGLAGPATSTVIVTSLIGGKAGLAELWQRLTRWRIAWWRLSVAAILLASSR